MVASSSQYCLNDHVIEGHSMSEGKTNNKKKHFVRVVSCVPGFPVLSFPAPLSDNLLPVYLIFALFSALLAC